MTEDTEFQDGKLTRGFGWALIYIGLLLVVGAYFYDVSVATGAAGLYGAPERVANTDKLAIRDMLHALGIALFMAGVLTRSTGAVITALRSDK